ncbi:hypothetical protein FisN_25Lh052 [Fistulifera solaris]|uniref:Uncharacterized protein n=1 Tax=Fistulifera solaris TaxID=1519565 RepID=A0A1Z5KA23_FISSO|nr:hypothetical protein FisN_25Lh052 [Fistulifera solaris]|eukprot:GAX23109.1 hypothetical protein FisN_25Lh052 [Fistulifera solaris]
MMANAELKPRRRLAVTLLLLLSIAVTSLVLSNSLWISIDMVTGSSFPADVVADEIYGNESNVTELMPANESVVIDNLPIKESVVADALPANESVTESSSNNEQKHCALLFFGLPRAFESLTLPSLRKNVLPYNKDCHIYVHFYQKEREAAGRSGRGGDIHSDEIYQLKQYVEKVHFLEESEAQFLKKRGDMLRKIRTTTDDNGNLLYMPWKEKSFGKDSATNIIKMWHSIESVWNLAEEHAQKEGIRYETIAVLRSDVFFLTPVRLKEFATSDTVVVPGFAKFPVNDRMIYGPYEGVKIWAAERFSRVDEHVRTNEEGYGIHDERLLNRTIFPAIREALQNDKAIVEHPTMCFLRARVDESVWLNDCDRSVLPSVTKAIGDLNDIAVSVETALGRSCEGPPKEYNKQVTYLNCPRPSIQDKVTPTNSSLDH